MAAAWAPADVGKAEKYGGCPWNPDVEGPGRLLTAATPVLNAILESVDKYGTTLAPADRQQVKGLATGIKNRTVTHQAGAARHEGGDNFAQVCIWLPGNPFTGPKNRADNPGDQFDASVRFIIGARQRPVHDAPNGDREDRPVRQGPQEDRLRRGGVHESRHRCPHPLSDPPPTRLLPRPAPAPDKRRWSATQP
ncbi:hypothetical protein OG879_33670 [Streptomyces caniferus]|uniref:Peptidase M15A C-terminal domain-containing protein n=1 Tax=Streptomyces caniferus TaxID=285557 RepID=A0ABZ1VHD8_9ACTN|nr:hypothetical protein [Streptomyces caniferus]